MIDNTPLEFVLEGVGKANFPNLRRVEIGGTITALTAGDVNRLDGLPDLIVGVANANSSELQIFQGLDDIFSIAPQIESLPAPAESIAVGQLNQNSLTDIAVATAGEVIILSGKDPAKADGEPIPGTLRLPQPGGVKSIVTGDLMPDRDSRTELAVLSPDGTIRIFARGSLDTRPVSKNEHLAKQVREYQAKGYPIPKRILARLTEEDLRAPLPRPAGDITTWAEAETVTTAAPNSRLSAQTVLTTGRISDGAADEGVAAPGRKRDVQMGVAVKIAGLHKIRRHRNGQRLYFCTERRNKTPVANGFPRRLGLRGKSVDIAGMKR